MIILEGVKSGVQRSGYTLQELAVLAGGELEDVLIDLMYDLPDLPHPREFNIDDSFIELGWEKYREANNLPGPDEKAGKKKKAKRGRSESKDRESA